MSKKTPNKNTEKSNSSIISNMKKTYMEVVIPNMVGRFG